MRIFKRDPSEKPVNQKSWKKRALKYGGVEELLKQKAERRRARELDQENDRLMQLEKESRRACGFDSNSSDCESEDDKDKVKQEIETRQLDTILSRVALLPSLSELMEKRETIFGSDYGKKKVDDVPLRRNKFGRLIDAHGREIQRQDNRDCRNNRSGQRNYKRMRNGYVDHRDTRNGYQDRQGSRNRFVSDCREQQGHRNGFPPDFRDRQGPSNGCHPEFRDQQGPRNTFPDDCRDQQGHRNGFPPSFEEQQGQRNGFPPNFQKEPNHYNSEYPNNWGPGGYFEEVPQANSHALAMQNYQTQSATGSYDYNHGHNGFHSSSYYQDQINSSINLNSGASQQYSINSVHIPSSAIMPPDNRLNAPPLPPPTQLPPQHPQQPPLHQVPPHQLPMPLVNHPSSAFPQPGNSFSVLPVDHSLACPPPAYALNHSLVQPLNTIAASMPLDPIKDEEDTSAARVTTMSRVVASTGEVDKLFGASSSIDAGSSSQEKAGGIPGLTLLDSDCKTEPVGVDIEIPEITMIVPKEEEVEENGSAQRSVSQLITNTTTTTKEVNYAWTAEQEVCKIESIVTRSSALEIPLEIPKIRYSKLDTESRPASVVSVQEERIKYTAATGPITSPPPESFAQGCYVAPGSGYSLVS